MDTIAWIVYPVAVAYAKATSANGAISCQILPVAPRMVTTAWTAASYGTAMKIAAVAKPSAVTASAR